MVKKNSIKIGGEPLIGIYNPNSQSTNRSSGNRPSTSSFKIESSGSGEELFNKLTQSGKQNLPQQINLKTKKKFNIINVSIVLIIIGLCFLFYINRESIKDYVHKLFNIKDEEVLEEEPKKEVFNILDNNYSYEEAENVCRSINGSKLASYDQILDSFNNGGEWCNYGWSQDGLALYPMQKKKENCGDRGINGGYFDKELKFGVNCYGVKPDESQFGSSYYMNAIDEIKKEEQDYIDDIEGNTKGLSINVLGFNSGSWSRYT